MIGDWRLVIGRLLWGCVLVAGVGACAARGPSPRLVAALVAALFAAASAAPFTPGSVLVLRLCDTAAPFNAYATVLNVSCALYLEEYGISIEGGNASASLLQTIALPTATSGTQRPCTMCEWGWVGLG